MMFSLSQMTNDEQLTADELHNMRLDADVSAFEDEQADAAAWAVRQMARRSHLLSGGAIPDALLADPFLQELGLEAYAARFAEGVDPADAPVESTCACAKWADTRAKLPAGASVFDRLSRAAGVAYASSRAATCRLMCRFEGVIVAMLLLEVLLCSAWVAAWAVRAALRNGSERSSACRCRRARQSRQPENQFLISAAHFVDPESQTVPLLSAAHS